MYLVFGVGGVAPWLGFELADIYIPISCSPYSCNNENIFQSRMKRNTALWVFQKVEA